MSGYDTPLQRKAGPGISAKLWKMNMEGLTNPNKRRPGMVPDNGPPKGRRRTFIATQHIYIPTHVDTGI